MQEKDNETRFLGQKGSYAVQTETFDASLLVPMLRSNTRELYDISGEEFIGYDIWHCHEATFLTDKGLPVSGTLKISIPSNSQYLPESKSFKLYLNSFDMCKMGSGVENACKLYEDQISLDLSYLLEEFVKVKFLKTNGFFSEIDPSKDYMDLVKLTNPFDIEFGDFTYSKNHLVFNQVPISETSPKKISYKVSTSLLRSRCRHTKQKDTGNAFFHIIMKEGYELELVSLLKQVISLRMLDEFHEFCAERLFIDLMKNGKIEALSVLLLYARRGSLDINPIRVSHEYMLNKDFIDVNKFTIKQQNQ